MRALLLFFMLVATVCGAADGPKPEVKSASLLGVPAGQTTRLILYGENLSPKSASAKSPLTV